ncbi:hypothetical protein [Microcystis phage Mel-JY01]
MSEKNTVTVYTETIWSFIKSKPIVFLIGAVIGTVLYMQYQRTQMEIFLRQNNKKIDSLSNLVEIKKKEYVELEYKVQELDSLLQRERYMLADVIQKYPKTKRKEITNKDSAVQFLYNFIGK